MKNKRIVKVVCPECKEEIFFKNYWHWVWKTPFHWLWWHNDIKRICDYRLIKCPMCGKKNWVRRSK